MQGPTRRDVRTIGKCGDFTLRAEGGPGGGGVCVGMGDRGPEKDEVAYSRAGCDHNRLG